MCRLVAVVASEITDFGLVLKDAPRSLARLSGAHPDGWGVAAHGIRESIPPPASRLSAEGTVSSEAIGHWRLHRGTERAADCARFRQIAERSAGTVLIAHVRQKTVGPTSLVNTHPFAQDGWVFAHNGTIVDQAYVRSRVSAKRAEQVRGATDSEMLFAFFLTRLDEANLLHPLEAPMREEATRILGAAAAELRERNAGAFSFLLSDGASCFIHRFGRSLFVLQRRPSDASRPKLDERWIERRHAVLVASERLTDEAWEELPEGAFHRIDRDPVPTIAT